MKILNNINQNKLLELIGIPTLPIKYYDKYDDFISFLLKHSDDFMSMDELSYTCNLLKIDTDVYEELKRLLDVINNDEDKKIACLYFCYITYHAFYSTANQLFMATKCSVLDDYILHAFTLLYPIKWRYNEATERKIPLSYINPQLVGIAHHVNRWIKTKKSDGVIRWDTITAYLELFPINTLTLEPFDNTVAWHAFVNKQNQKIILMYEGRKIRKDGQFDGVNGVYDYSFTTIYQEDENYYIGNPVDPYGLVLNQVVKLSKDEWVPSLKKDDWIIEFHVSSQNPYTIENFQESLKRGIKFFKKYYPERNFVCTRGYSWLFSPQLKYILDENKGNISRIKKCGYTIPTATGEGNVFNFVFHNTDILPEEIPETTSLYRGIKKYLLSGGRINCGEMIFFLDDLDHMLDNVYFETFPKILSSLKD